MPSTGLTLAVPIGNFATMRTMRRMRKMQRMARWCASLPVCAIIGSASIAAAQLPVCPQPEADAPYYSACLPSGRFLVASVLTSFAIDQLLRADTAPFVRRPREILESVSTEALLEKNAALVDYLGRLEPLKFSRLDTSTGLVALGANDEVRSFDAVIDVDTVPYSVSVQLPERVEGGYWRTPGVLQVAFWEGHRATLALTTPGGIDMQAQIDCLVVSTDGIRVLTAGSSTPDLLVRFGECQ